MNDVVKHDSSRRDVSTESRQTVTLWPAVDIYEEDNALYVVADMPGVPHDGLQLEVDNNVLSIEGEISLDMPEGMSAIYAELRGQRFARRFTLSHEIDSEAIEARLENGVLNVRLPKKETHRRRRIEIQAA
ncbi:Hsp20/alpha crystallin family protein [Aidingimonas halophila]|uniref:Molecular chaperone IbpA, HSP20 family n=1 Tax=Aidingimonas halophila TaxID=574349 RepID=A0A1H3FVY5_9GAMM|nr:Hsp20/alpha crystallin family protein [Aidingimonas halophila]GHC38478.1 heat-shock protein [Aidingimonas halophila]SDX94324.1 Molecular chaperone IbpA, HSP20 family [Aidingimonas halophila]